MKETTVSLLLLFASVMPMTAQVEGGGEKKVAGGRVAWFVATSIPDDIENPMDVMSGKEIKKVTLSKRMASDAVKIPADGIIRIIRAIPQPKDPSKPPYEILAEARIPETTNEALVILVPALRKETTAIPVFNTKVQDLAKFRGGDYMYMNLTNLKVAVELGEKRTGIKPGEVIIHDSGALGTTVNTPISYYFFNPKVEEWKLISASTVVIQPTRREICIFSWDPNYNRIDYHGITFPVTKRAAEN